MNLLHLIPYYAPAWAYGGVVRAATDLTRALVAAGHHVTVLTTDTLSPNTCIEAERDLIDGVQVVRVRNRSNRLRGKLNLSTPIDIQKIARTLITEHAIQVVHCHELRTIENWRVAPVANRLQVPLIVSPHGTLPYYTGRQSIKQIWDRVLGRRLLPRFDRVIALTEDEAADARAIWANCGLTLPAEQIDIIPNGIHFEDFETLPSGMAFRERWSLGAGPVVLFLGRLHERKGLQILIPALAGVVSAVPDVRLLIVGPDEGMADRLQELVQEHRLAEHVIFTGLLTGDDKLAALAAADIFALPAVGEGFSMAVLEALACGLPVIVTPGCYFPEVAEAGAGLVIAREVTAWQTALHTLLTDHERRVSMGRSARALVQARFTWPHIVTQLEALYQQVIASRNRI